MTIYNGEVYGSLTVYSGDDVSRLTSVGGSLSIEAEGAQFPVLTSVKGHDLPDDDTARARLLAVAHRVVNDPSALDMGQWHNESGGCGTVHCIAGWAVHLAGTDGYALENKVDGTLAAGNILLGAEASGLFFLAKAKALAALEHLIAEAGVA